ncbi:Rap1a/Tai family immunity protein [uncultured Thiohalocapsa sp.]|uniref:Rap1a/Tai family immunity protein n=1 Tax=uncultured Thiohalocapsa sp. TaxID=768990 RepID=UPI0025EA9E4A|nr:Rap1a/Tai family immunity protein [uncultured Thiohalocapsa sp.]
MSTPIARHILILPLAAASSLVLAAPLLTTEPATAVRAGPTVAQLLAVCERARIAGGVGVDAAMCEWYGVPCDCAVKAPEAAPRWCLPEAESTDTVLAKVLAQLRRAPNPQAPVAAVVPAVMARLYPCAGAPTP